MHWFWRATIAVVGSAIILISLKCGIYMLAPYIPIPRVPIAAVFYVLNLVAPVSVYGVLTYRYGPVRPENSIRPYPVD